jgi:DNA-binding NarL/FixJ family response regulator
MKSQTLYRNTALIVSRSSQLRESLLVLLRAIPRIVRVYQAEDLSSALALPLKPPPILVLCDYDLSNGEVTATLRRVKAAWPGTRCVVLVEDEPERRAAEAAGVDVALIKGVLAARLLEEIEQLLGETVGKQGSDVQTAS